MPQTTAVLREEARQAQAQGDFQTAARLYDEAADRYPFSQGDLAKADIAALRRRAASCRESAQPPTIDEAMTTLAVARGGRETLEALDALASAAQNAAAQLRDRLDRSAA